jgi:U3 small nucleolar RNA-associated protein MPP10
MSILTTLSASPQAFLQPTPQVSSDAIDFVKTLLDPLASSVADAQKARRDSNRRKRKRTDDVEAEQVLQLRTVYTSGLTVKQVWEQARRVLDAACAEVERSLPQAIQPRLNGGAEHESDMDELEGESQDDEDPFDDELEAEEDKDEMSVDEEVELDRDNESIQDDSSDEDVGAEEEQDYGFSDEATIQQETYNPDPNGLNDGFFSIDDFNRQSQFMEQMDARGEDDNPSDEDDVDWEASPLTTPVGKNIRADANPPNADDSDDEGGPTFWNADLDAPDSDENIDDEDGYLDDGVSGLSNTNEIRYADFFEPPPKKPSRTKRMRALPKTQPPKVSSNNALGNLEDDSLDIDVQRAMDDVNRDIFASESDLSGSDDDSDPDVPRSKNLSTHEKQRAKIAAEIRRLEAFNVAKRDWTLSGEARAADRPLNSLIEEDLEFERVGKPVPVITAEVTEDIEQLIKRRILALEFDEVIRRRPDAFGGASEVRRGRAEVDDTKPQTGLAEMYEQDHLRATDPGFVDKRSAATKKQHEEIDRLWKNVSYQLDLLSNLHFKPRRVDMEIKTVEDKPKIAMEDARPVGEGIGMEESMLAPQEVYKAGDIRREGEVTGKSGASVSKEEMSREEKLRKRRREKERVKKGKTNAVEVKKLGAPLKKGKKEEKQGILDDLRKGNVKVMDKKGEMQNLGKDKGQAREVSSSALKL